MHKLLQLFFKNKPVKLPSIISTFKQAKIDLELLIQKENESLNESQNKLKIAEKQKVEELAKIEELAKKQKTAVNKKLEVVLKEVNEKGRTSTDNINEAKEWLSKIPSIG